MGSEVFISRLEPLGDPTPQEKCSATSTFLRVSACSMIYMMIVIRMCMNVHGRL